MAIVKLGELKTQMLRDKLGLDIASAWGRGRVRDQGSRLYLRDGRTAHYYPKERRVESPSAGPPE